MTTAPTSVPPAIQIPRRTKSGVAATRLGLLFGALLAALFAVLGSPWSGAAISLIAVAIAYVTFFVPDSVSLQVVAVSLISLTWLVGWFVCYRTGGISSPAIVWAFFHPITAYAVLSRRWAVIWICLSGVQVVGFFTIRELDWVVRHDLSETSANALRTSGFVICIIAVALVMIGAESVRHVSQTAIDDANRALERQRILSDMHDGLGSQLLGLVVQVRAKRIDDERLLQGLAACLDDLKLIVDSLDPSERSFALAVAELRARIAPRCEAAGVRLDWTTDDHPPAINAERTLQVLRALQEMTTNALRHSGTDAMVVRLKFADNGADVYEVHVRDFGVGVSASVSARTGGRGLTSLETRAQRLGGTLHIADAHPGTTVAIIFPTMIEPSEGVPARRIRRLKLRA